MPVRRETGVGRGTAATVQPPARYRVGCYTFIGITLFSRSFGPCGSSDRVRDLVGEWLSLVEHLVRDQGVGGSNPLSPTNLSLALSVV